jgi:predicted metal-dependent hydrolase
MTTLAYRIRVSPRAKYPRLKMSARDGLVVVIPDGFDESRVASVLEGKREWIKRAEQRLAEQRKFLVPRPNGAHPERITLRVIGEEWSVDYRPTDASTVTSVERPGQRLLVYGAVADDLATREALRRWLTRKTREHIGPWLLRLAQDHGFDVSQVVVRSQRTRWASCSATKTISLNVRLLFLPEPLVRYVLHHELAHTREMNHGNSYWAILQGLEPDYRSLDDELRSAWQLVPEWIRPSRSRST